MAKYNLARKQGKSLIVIPTSSPIYPPELPIMLCNEYAFTFLICLKDAACQKWVLITNQPFLVPARSSKWFKTCGKAALAISPDVSSCLTSIFVISMQGEIYF